MKILNYNLTTKQTNISKQIAMKNIFVKDILDITARDENVFQIYELDFLYTKQNLEYISKIINTHINLMDIMGQIVKYTPNKEIKRLATPTSMILQTQCNLLYNIINKYEDFKNLNSLLLLHFPYPKVDKLMTEYIEKYPNTVLDYADIMKQLKDKCSTIDIRKFILLGCNLNSDILFPDEKKHKLPSLRVDSTLTFKETKKIPMFINMMMSFCVWGFHILFEQNYIKHILFFNPYSDILLLNYRKSAQGCSKVDFFVALPYTENIINNMSARTKYITQAIKEHY